MNEKQKEYIKAYTKEKRVRISLNLSKDQEGDILDAIDKTGKGNKQAGIKRLIRTGIKYEELQTTHKEKI